ncbi:CRISPR-associated endoribonuclease Cas6 [Caloranaerobacter azorensis DSM 13643]|uniref:CRISPR-associated endoribonuclease n=1 Tax=Caloranaerobacter azorensis DSM 13643 TaxID=1121264 RepID=A0A1M5UHF1_9FIRM|nr:CRISPR-associated endoribonuclease Cas6 [Caloranaerobacter azorensis]SHH62399.1 CRISPR-associated endoribonuclease Cas6 [Caloranaerobacter azorensis DSM 13643]
MRLSIEFSFKDKLVLPIHYNHILQGFIYNNISDNAFRNFLHDEGYKYEKRSFKLFTFSRIFGQFKMDKQSNTITFSSPIKLIVSSILDDFVNDFASTLIKKDDLILGKTQIRLEKIEVFSHPEVEEEIVIKMLSPTVTYSTVDVHGKKKTIYHKPGDGVFSELAYKNLQKKYKSFYGKDMPECEFSIKPVNDEKIKMISANYRGFIIKGWIGEFIMKGSKELIKLAYDTGLGSKNAQGFGCFEIVGVRR